MMVCGLVWQPDSDVNIQSPSQPVNDAQAEQVQALQAEIVQLQAQVETLHRQNQILENALADEQGDMAQVVAGYQALQNDYARLAQEMETYKQAAARDGQAIAIAP